MSDYRVLYYPRFEPKPTWLLSTLLFVDGVNRIIPDDAEHKDSRWIAELREALSPDPAEPFSTQQKDLWIQLSDRQRMKRAFESIIEDYQAKAKSGQSPELQYDVIYRAKIPFEVEKLLRGKKGTKGPSLLKDIKDSYKTVEVERRTGELVLSYVANRIATREGIDAITDYQIGFAVNALENQRIAFDQPAGFAEGSLIGAIASCQIPAEIRYLSMDAYKELRHQYSGTRATFKKLAIELAQMSNLRTIDNPTVFQKRLDTTVQDFVKECDQYATTRVAKKVKKWLPWGIGSLVGLAAGLAAPVAGFAGKVAQVGFQVVDRGVNQQTKDVSEQRPHQMLCNLKRDVLRRSPVKSMLHL
jgi:hypothetical protein